MASGDFARGNLDRAFAGFEQRRNALSVPLYHYTCDMARLEPPTQQIVDFFVGLQRSQEDTDAYFGVFAQTVPVSEFFATENVDRIGAATTA